VIGIKSGLGLFLFQKQDSICLDAFRVALGAVMLLYMTERWYYAAEWLTARGFHVSQPNLSFHPFATPLLPEAWLPWFGVVFFGGILCVITGLKPSVTVWSTFLCVCYVTFADQYSAFTVNKLFIVSLAVLGFGPKGPYFSFTKGQGPMQSVWPVRVLQLSFLVHYFCAGWQKIVHGDWLANPFALYTQMQGVYRTEFAGWLYQNVPVNGWILMQYLGLGFELLAPALFVFKSTRRAAFIWGLAFQSVLALSMHQLVYFMLAMSCFYILFMEEKTLHKLTDWNNKRVSWMAA